MNNTSDRNINVNIFSWSIFNIFNSILIFQMDQMIKQMPTQTQISSRSVGCIMGFLKGERKGGFLSLLVNLFSILMQALAIGKKIMRKKIIQKWGGKQIRISIDFRQGSGKKYKWVFKAPKTNVPVSNKWAGVWNSFATPPKPAQSQTKKRVQGSNREPIYRLPSFWHVLCVSLAPPAFRYIRLQSSEKNCCKTMQMNWGVFRFWENTQNYPKSWFVKWAYFIEVGGFIWI